MALSVTPVGHCTNIANCYRVIIEANIKELHPSPPGIEHGNVKLLEIMVDIITLMDPDTRYNSQVKPNTDASSALINTKAL
ncbi:hypothetical protein DSO57_1033688 [Entomophthora muscae]|uniref:Uncharacterized protein n=1 Tax=Entomophthora muscae TaxID=34485 RepID=A0ACC2UA81_9FUNG|nr:hypothetical protein DSO57_1033688 [Entomophthora muscae]